MRDRGKHLINLAVIAILVASSIGCSREPDELSVRRFYDTNKPTLERLLAMSNQDYSESKVIRIAHHFTRLENNWAWPRPESEWGITTARWKEYKSLFSSVGLPYGLNRDGKEYQEVYFPVWGEGIADNSREKGVVFSLTVQSDLQQESQRITYKSLAEHWYYYEWVTW